MTDKEFNPDEFKADNPEPSMAEKFAASVKSVDELSPEKREEYKSLLEDSPPNERTAEEVLAEVEELVSKSSVHVNLTDSMREEFIRALVANKPYTYTFNYQDDKLSVSFKTLTVKEYDAIADAIAEYSKTEGFETASHLKFLNYKYNVACSLSGIVVKDSEGVETIHHYDSPLEEYDMDFIEKEESTVRVDGSTRTKVVKTRIKDRDRITMAYSDRFNEMESTMYNLILNAHTEFDRQVNALAMEMYKENFTQEEPVSSP